MHRSVIFAISLLTRLHVSPLVAQDGEIKLDSAQEKITTVSAMRARRAPQITADEVRRLKLGTVVSANARSAQQETISGKTTHATEAIKNLTAALTDDVIKRANDKGGDKYAVEERTQLRKLFASFRLAIAKTSVVEKTELLKRLNRVARG